MSFPKVNRLLGGLAVMAGLLTLAAFRVPPEESPFRRIVKSLLGFYATTLPEKAYLHLDRPYYASDETVWFKAYLAEADSHRPDTLSKILYVELISPQRRIVARRTLHLLAGVSPGDLALPDTLAAGTYQLRAYTNWMRNAGPEFFFSRPLAVLDAQGKLPAGSAPTAKTDLQFFPEGGSLIDELESEVGFRAVDGHGHGVAVQGVVLDAQGREVARFQSRHLGMGTFRLAPAAGQRYRAVVAGPGGARIEYPLPASQPTGYALRVSETETDFLVTIRRHPAPGAAPAGPAMLLAQVRGQVSFAVSVPGAGATPVAVRLAKAKFQPGLAHLTLFDEQGTAECERLVFVPNPPGVRLTFTPDKTTYAPTRGRAAAPVGHRCRRPAGSRAVFGVCGRRGGSRRRPDHCDPPAAELRPGGAGGSTRLLFPRAANLGNPPSPQRLAAHAGLAALCVEGLAGQPTGGAGFSAGTSPDRERASDDNGPAAGRAHRRLPAIQPHPPGRNAD